mmetsp:Transcript_31492/g.77994  ORF Transcript_31492/g.77994 Transcript_31492/m.77994 type:complete len:205 (-) Transcript_31492:66-680(-)
MHIIYEGTMLYEVRNLLTMWSQRGWMTMADLQRCLKRVVHSYNSSRDRVSRVPDAPSSFSPKAASMMHFAPLLCVLLSESIPDDASDSQRVVALDHVHCFKKHVAISSRIQQRRISQREIDELGGMIEDWAHDFVRLYGRGYPKLHAYMHFPLDIARFGPLRSVWCFPFEAKHQTVKKWCKTSNDVGHEGKKSHVEELFAQLSH